MTNSSLVGSTFFGIDISRLGDRLLSFRRRVSKRVLLLEFSPGSLHLAEASLTQAGVQLSHISRVVLPPDALERGVPSEPDKMAQLIKEICAEKKIPAHRLSVVLPPDVAFQRLISLPSDIRSDQAHNFVLDPGNGLQVPFPLAQTDFDLYPVSIPSASTSSTEYQSYMLIAMPKLLVDRIIDMASLADMELQFIELASFSQLRTFGNSFVHLNSRQVELVLELNPDSSYLTLVNSSGVLALERIASIRDFPDPELSPDDTSSALQIGLSAESIIFKNENYLPLSDLDLRVLVSDLKNALHHFCDAFPDVEVVRLRLCGINSAHPMLTELLHDSLGLPVSSSHPLLLNGIAGFSFDNVLVQAGLGRLVGLSLSMISNKPLQFTNHDSKSLAEIDASTHAISLLDLLDKNADSSASDLLQDVSDFRKYNITEDGNVPVSISDQISESQSSPILDAESLLNEAEDLTGIAQDSKHPNILSSHGEAEHVDFVDVIVDGQDNELLSSKSDSGQLADTAISDSALQSEAHWPSISVRSNVSDELVDDRQDWPSISTKNHQKSDFHVPSHTLDREDGWPSILNNDEDQILATEHQEVPHLPSNYDSQTSSEATHSEDLEVDRGDITELSDISVLRSSAKSYESTLAEPSQSESITESNSALDGEGSLGELRLKDPE